MITRCCAHCASSLQGRQKLFCSKRCRALASHAPSTAARALARAAGAKTYTTGTTCQNGHSSERRTSTGSCVACAKIKEARYASAHAEKLRTRRRNAYAKDPSRDNAAAKAWRQRNPGKIKALARAAYARVNPEINRQKSAAWRAANPEKKREWFRLNAERMGVHHRNRRALLTGGGKHTLSDIKEILAAQGFRCAYCKKSIQKARHIDHIIPLKRGGSNNRRNLQALCPTCNTRKHDADPIDFARRIGLLL